MRKRGLVICGLSGYIGGVEMEKIMTETYEQVCEGRSKARLEKIALSEKMSNFRKESKALKRYWKQWKQN